MARSPDTFDGYHGLDRLGSTAGAVLFRARRASDGRSVLLKISAHPPGRVADERLAWEFETLRALDVPGVVRPIQHLAARPDVAPPALVLPDFAGPFLEALLDRRSVGLPACLRLGCHLARALEGLHAARLVHRDLRPANILAGEDADSILIVDFSRAAFQEREPLADAADIDWAYVSPEQTGRVDRPVDHRTDLYSLGVVLYRMVAGKLPFQAADPLEWSHCHIARVPPPPSEVAPRVPAALSAIVMKLLAKDPDDRYQTARGLRHDLERCREAWDATGSAPIFPLATRDVSDRLQLSSRLFGREVELARLRRVFDQVAAVGHPVLCLVSGQEGAGKSSLVQHLRESVTARGGDTGSARFERFHRDTPYTFLSVAFRGLLQRILSGSEEDVAAWRRRLEEALGAEAQAVAAVIPLLELILGEQPPLGRLPSADAQFRFKRVVRQFIGVFARADHPLMLFLDDVQWADRASLALLSDLVGQAATGHLMVVAAFRNTELDAGHPLTSMLESLPPTVTPVEVRLEPLGEEHLCELIGSALHCDPREAGPLAALLKQRTGGNPFLARQFLGALEQQGLISFDARQSAWRWDVDRIRGAAVSETVVPLTAGQIARMEAGTRELLAWAACLGREFGLGSLARLSGQTQAAVAELLRPAVSRGLILTSVGDLVGEADLAAPSHGYRWFHDRVRQAAHSLIAAEDLSRRHLAIARLLLPGTDRSADDFFVAVTHFNRATALLTDEAERLQVAELNLAAGQRAQATFAYASALHYLAAAATLLPPDPWQRHERIASPLWLAQAECHLYGGNPRETLRLAGVVAARAHAKLDQAAAHTLVQEAHVVLGESEQAVVAARACLTLLGIDLPLHPSWTEVTAERARVQRLLGERTIESLADVPSAPDPEREAMMRLPPYSYLTDQNLFCLQVTRMVAINLEHGPVDGSCLWYGLYAWVLAGFFDDYRQALGFAKLAWELATRSGIPAHQIQVLNQMSAVSFWTQSLDQSLAEARTTLRRASESGNTLFLNYATLTIAQALMARNEPLAKVAVEIEGMLAFTRYPGIKINLLICRQMVQALRGCTGALTSLGDEHFDAEDFERRLSDPAAERPDASATFYYWSCRMQVAYIAEDFAQARAASDRALPLLGSHTARSPYRDFCLYHALTLAQHQQDEHDEARLAELAARMRRWAETNPETFGANDALLRAEQARLDGRPWGAATLYDESVRRAHRAGLPRDEALACQVAAGFYRQHQQGDVAEMYLRKARDCWARWGADGKVKQLDQGPLRTSGQAAWTGAERAVAAERDRPPHPEALAERLDLMAVVRASQALSGEIVLPRLMQTLMRTVLETAGAQQGSLLLAEGAGLRVAAVAAVDGSTVQVAIRPDGAEGDGALPWSVINYVQRTGEKVVLADAQERGPFAADPYLVHKRPRSLLCLPIVRQTSCVGLLYLESGPVANAFTADRLVALELMAAQAAISLDHARLFERAQRENAERKRAEERFSQAFQASPAPMAIMRLHDQVLLDINESHLRVLGLTRAQAVGRAVEELGMMEAAQVDQMRQTLRRKGSVREVELTVRTAPGEVRTLLTSVELLELGGEECALSAGLDITERKRAEDQLRQAQKMEAIGRLAGGVAHDFNNLLTAINGYSSLALRGIDASHPLFLSLREILRAGERAAGLTRQLLAHSRKQVLAPRVWDVNLIVEDLQKLLKRLIGEDIDLVATLAAAPALVNVDRGQMEQIVLNLALNARDAMPTGGRLTLQTAHLLVPSADHVTPPEVRPGPHVMLAVSDNGVGMSAEVKLKLFEPFFTTKEPGQGTGLGLSTVYGIVKQSGGGICVESVPGTGTTFRLYFPRASADDRAVTSPLLVDGPDAFRGDATILLVEDDDLVRKFAVQALESYGYRMLQARDGREAFAVLDRTGEPVRLVITDVVMPDMGGRELAERMRHRFPTLPVLYFSGYEEQGSGRAREDSFLQKPFGPSELARKVRQVLDRAGPRAEARGLRPPAP